MAVSRFVETRALEDEVADLEERLETRRLVDRAKARLQADHKMTEAQAFRFIQKTSMDRRLSMREVAKHGARHPARPRRRGARLELLAARPGATAARWRLLSAGCSFEAGGPAPGAATW